jgi:hypothetical protein
LVRVRGRRRSDPCLKLIPREDGGRGFRSKRRREDRAYKPLIPVRNRAILACLAFLFVVASCGRSPLTMVADTTAIDGAMGADSTAESDVSRACSGTEPVETNILSGLVPQCQMGFAHPNVCCQAGPDTPTSCSESPQSPFQVCGCDALTFPDPRTCCSLADGSKCQPTGPAVDGGADAGQCSYPCGPGAYSPKRGGVATKQEDACTDVPNVPVDGGGAVPSAGCSYCCFQGACATDTSGCGASGCPPVTWGCGACPTGWDNAQGIPDVCCRMNTSMAQECFSQAAKINTNGGR